MDWWLFAVHGLGGGVRQVLRDPADMLVVIGLTLVSAVFHECGHAAGLPVRRRADRRDRRRHLHGLARVLHQRHRLLPAVPGRRLRTDLGGLYFNAVFMLALAGFYAATSSEVLLLVIALTHLEMLEQLMPFARFDGYFILSDLVGVPDLFARVAPIVKSALPGDRQDPRVTGLRRRARIVVTAWVLCVIPLLAFSMGISCCTCPPSTGRCGTPPACRRTSWPPRCGPPLRGGRGRRDRRRLVILSVAGSLYIVTGLARRLTALGRRWSAGRPARRLLAGATGLAALAGLAAFWTLQGQFRGW